MSVPDLGYDIKSIMHYDGYSFTNNGLPTITYNDGLDSPVQAQQALSEVRKQIDEYSRMI